MQELKQQEKEVKQKQIESNKRKAEEIRKAAMEGRASMSFFSHISQLLNIFATKLSFHFNLMFYFKN